MTEIDDLNFETPPAEKRIITRGQLETVAELEDERDSLIKTIEILTKEIRNLRQTKKVEIVPLNTVQTDSTIGMLQNLEVVPENGFEIFTGTIGSISTTLIRNCETETSLLIS